MVRPEAVVLRDAIQDGGLEATVEEAVFLGNLTDYKLRLIDGTAVEAQVIGEPTHAPGSTVAVSFDESRTWLVR